MRVVPNDERLIPPFLCFLCETHPQREQGVHVVDTGRNFDPPAPVQLKGRKLVCERCVDEAARLFGYVKQEDIEDVDNTLRDVRDRASRILAVAQGLADQVERELGVIIDIAPPARTRIDKTIKKENEDG